MQSRKQADLILLDFSKAFVKVAHENYLINYTLWDQGEHSKIGLKTSLITKKQLVLLNGSNFDNISVSSGVPQFLVPCCFCIRKHAYSNILKISPPKNESFQIKILIFFIFLL